MAGKKVINLREKYGKLPPEQQKAISEALGRQNAGPSEKGMKSQNQKKKK